MLLAETAKQLSRGYVYGSELLQGLEEHIKYSAGKGETNCKFYTDGEHFSDSELNFIKQCGYTIYWNSPCLWYEVSWE